MKRAASWVFYVVGLLAIAYLALYAYVTLSGRDFQPGDPIHIFRRPDAPNYSFGAPRFVNHFKRSAILSAAALAHTSSLSPPGAPPTPMAPTI
jgi:hypothetical protein